MTTEQLNRILILLEEADENWESSVYEFYERAEWDATQQRQKEFKSLVKELVECHRKIS